MKNEKNKLLMILYYLSLRLVSIVIAPASCDEATYNRDQSFTDMYNHTFYNITIDDIDEYFLSINTIYSPTTWPLENWENNTLLNDSTSIVNWTLILNDTFRVSNASDDTQVLGVDNYTLNPTTGVVSWGLDGETVIGWNNTLVEIYYNKTINATSTNLVDADNTWTWESEGQGDWGQDRGWRVLTYGFNGTDWDVNYNYVQRTCIARDSCRTTQVVIYGGFGLMIVMAIAAAAFLIISFTGGDVSTAAAGAVTTAVIGLGIIVMVGYYIISAVGLSVCG